MLSVSEARVLPVLTEIALLTVYHLSDRLTDTLTLP